MTQIADSDGESDNLYKTSSGDCGFVTRFARMVPLPINWFSVYISPCGGYPSFRLSVRAETMHIMMLYPLENKIELFESGPPFPTRQLSMCAE